MGTRWLATAMGLWFGAGLFAGWGPSTARAAGEPDVDGFPSWEERVHHELTNRARVDPQLEMTACGANCGEAACYTVQPPLHYNPLLGRAARFHAAHMGHNSYFAHNSSCTLVSNIASLYPNTCDGEASCSCEGGVNACSGACTTAGQRVGLFAGSYGGEIIAGGGTPNSAFYLWLYEPASDPTCQFTMANGHRWLLLTSSSGVGFGVDGYHVGDFGAPDSSWVHPIPSGSHWPRQSATVELWANWYDTGAPLSALVNVASTCHAMTLERGTGDNGAFRADVSGVGTGCHRYYFVFTDSANNQVTFPTTGSLGIGPAGSCDDWNTERPALGTGCNCTASCGAAVCGDDGCGGSCGSCGANEQCQAGQCVPTAGLDAGPPVDATTSTDGGVVEDANLPPSDGSAPSGDGGDDPPGNVSGGCRCRASDADASGSRSAALLIMGLLLWGLVWRRRRR